MTEVFLNGKFVGAVENPQDFISRLKTERRSGGLDTEEGSRGSSLRVSSDGRAALAPAARPSRSALRKGGGPEQGDGHAARGTRSGATARLHGRGDS